MLLHYTQQKMLAHIYSYIPNCYFLATPTINPNKPYHYVIRDNNVIRVHILEVVTDLPSYLCLFRQYIIHSAHDIVKYTVSEDLLISAVEYFNCSEDKVTSILKHTFKHRCNAYNRTVVNALLHRVNVALLIDYKENIYKNGYSHLLDYEPPNASYITNAIKHNNVGELLYILSDKSYKYIHNYINRHVQLSECNNIEIARLLLPYIDKDRNPIDYCIVYGLLYDKIYDIKETNHLAIALYAYHKGVTLPITNDINAYFAEMIYIFDIPIDTIYKFISTLSMNIIIPADWYTDYPDIIHIIRASNTLLGNYESFTLDDCSLCDKVRNTLHTI